MAGAKPATVVVPATTGPKVYGVAKNLTHDNEEYAPGDAVELTEKQARELLALGTVVDPDTKDLEVSAA